MLLFLLYSIFYTATKIKMCYRFFLFFLLITSSLMAQFNNVVNFKHIGEGSNLSNNWVRSIYQDSEGFMWFGTADGLNRFDGYECKVFRPQADNGIDLGLVNINGIELKEEKSLWVATNQGVYVLKENTLLRYNELPNLVYRGLLRQDDTYVWFYGTNYLSRLNSKTGEIKEFLKDPKYLLPKTSIKASLKDSKGNIWFGGVGFIAKYNIIEDAFEIFNDFVGIDTSTRNDVLGLAEDMFGKIWIGFGQNGLYYQSAIGSKVFKKHSGGNIINLKVDKDNLLWVAKASDQGLVCINLNTNTSQTYKYNIRKPNSISDSSIFSVYEDNTGDIWVGTFGGGINYYSKRSKKIFSIKQGLGSNTLKSNLVNAILEDDTYLWIGTGGGLDRKNKSTGVFKHYEYENNNINSLRRDPVQSLCKDVYGNLWVGVWDGGLHKYNKEKDNFKRYFSSPKAEGSLLSDHVISIHQDKQKRLWIGTAIGGLHLYDYATDSFKSLRKSKSYPKGISVKSVTQIHDFKEDYIFFNTYQSINFYNHKTGDHKEYDLSKYIGVNSAGVLCSYIDSDGKIWVGSRIGLFNFDEKKEQFTPFIGSISSQNVSILAIIEDDEGFIWATTNRGILRIDKHTHHVIQLTRKDGFNSNDFKNKATYKNKNGVLYFGTSLGLNYFDPKDLVLNKKEPNLTITSLSVLKSSPNKSNSYEYIIEDLSSSKEIILNTEQSSFVICFTGLNYLTPEKNTYTYKLEGYDKVWVDSNYKRTATYTNLDAGEYVFKIKGANSDGLESTVTKEIKIIKKSSWYLSNWFKTLIGILLISLPFVFYFVRLSIFKKQRKILRNRVRKRTEELTAANELLVKQTNRIQNQNKELSTHRNNLENIVAERTLELENAKIKAEESDRLKSAFIANMSHEIRTPMNAIYGFSGLLEEDISKQERKEYIEIIKDSCDSLLVLIDDILDISIMDAQGIQLSIQELNVDDFLRHIEMIFKQHEKANVPVSFVSESAGESVIIKTDPVRLRQILNNLINNSIKFTEKGSVEFGYSKNENQITFFVKDTGIGISKKDLSIIFKPFIKAGNNAFKIYRGTGIGLSISERIVNTFKGEIWVESELGKGAIFYVKLPL